MNASLLLRGTSLGLGSQAANQRAEALLRQAGIELHRQVADTETADLACTGSRAPAWLEAAGLPVDPEGSGRVLTEASLQVLGHPDLFACGDCGLIQADPRPASGVWAVRAAPILARNLKRTLEHPDAALIRWTPQHWALQLLGAPHGSLGGPQPSAPDSALALWGPWALGPHRWLWRWKEHIDRQFMAGFSDLGAMGAIQAPDPEAAAAGLNPMACRGCAAKLAAGPLTRALARLQGDDAAVHSPPQAEDAPAIGTDAEGQLLLQSVDGFPALVDDPWLNGRLTTLHACSDLWACGAEVSTVQALVTLPEASERLQEELLLQSLAGVRSVLDPLGATLIGGHTLEGRDGAGLAVALTVNGRAPQARHWPKGPLQAGDVLILCRPIGTGVLFAGAMTGHTHPAWLDQALGVMQQSQAPLVALLADHGCRACTDVTGFGLLGHLLEMLQGSRARLLPDAIPALPGALELLEQGIASTLAPANAQALLQLGENKAVVSERPLRSPELGLLIDPQTCGPLLAAVPRTQATALLTALRSAGFDQAAVVADVVGPEES